jgi:hypothetical protein
MRRRYDHVDLRVRSLAEARPFYETLLPALGFTRDVRIEHWLQSKQPVRTVRLSFSASPSRRGMSRMNAGSPHFAACSLFLVFRLTQGSRTSGVMDPSLTLQ